MTGRHCAACRTRLPAHGPDWKTLCSPCFVESKKRERAELLDLLAELREENARLRERPALDPAMLRTLLQLCHPDKHGGSLAAHKATQYLLALRREGAEVAQ